jgi:hypothetical protein
MRATVQDRQQAILDKLPPTAKLSLALDCWTSPFQQAFMAITGYFIDSDWNYREVLLGFEPLHGVHSGANLSTVLLAKLEQHNITNRVITITTDNASNNHTLIETIEESIQSLQSLSSLDRTEIIRIPCIAHVIQLSLNELLGHLKANPKNERTERVWSEAHKQALRTRPQNKDIANTLNKVRVYLTQLTTMLTLSDRFETLQCTSTEVLSAETHFAVSRRNHRRFCQSKMSKRAGIRHS